MKVEKHFRHCSRLSVYFILLAFRVVDLCLSKTWCCAVYLYDSEVCTGNCPQAACVVLVHFVTSRRSYHTMILGKEKGNISKE